MWQGLPESLVGHDEVPLIPEGEGQVAADVDALVAHVDRGLDEAGPADRRVAVPALGLPVPADLAGNGYGEWA